MSLADIIKNGKGTAGKWSVKRVPACMYDSGLPNSPFPQVAELHHYATCMLVWNDNREILSYSHGYGSVSDQNGMNTAFKILGMDLYYSRKNGARFINTNPNLDSCPECDVTHIDKSCVRDDRKLMPRYLRP